MTTETRNEAADYLRLGMPKPLHAKLGEALATERRATVERIRRQVDGEAFRAGLTPAAMLVLDRISVVLDTEAAR